MTVDEALLYAEAHAGHGFMFKHDGDVIKELANEVHRLRAENAELQSQRDTALENYAEQKAIYEGLCK